VARAGVAAVDRERAAERERGGRDVAGAERGVAPVGEQLGAIGGRAHGSPNAASARANAALRAVGLVMTCIASR